MYNCNSIYAPSTTENKICEDYSVNKFIDNTCVIALADGCSSSGVRKGCRLPINTDLGSRLIAISALNAVEDFLQKQDNLKKEEIAQVLTYMVHPQLVFHRNNMKLQNYVFDATLMLAFIGEKYPDGYICVWGDGVVVIETEKSIIAYEIEYDSNAPYYFSYILDSERSKAYTEHFGNQSKRLNIVTFEKEEGNIVNYESSTLNLYEPFWIDTKSEKFINQGEIKSISLFSDGIQQIVDENNTTMPEMYLHSCNFKNKKGVFVERSFNLLKRYMRENNLKFADDFSMASIVKLEG